MTPVSLHIGSGVGPEWLNWTVQLDVLFLCVALLYGYFYLTTQLRWRLPEAGRVPRRQTMLFVSGVAVLYAAGGGPIHELADRYLVSAHMLQHVLLMLVAAPLLLAGVPGWFWSAFLQSPQSLRIARLMTHPVVALSVFNGVFLMTHLPEAVDLQLRAWWFHLFVHVAQVGAGMLLWWPILNNAPELPRLSYPYQMMYLFGQSLVPSVLAGVLTFATGAVYPAYAEFPRLWGISIVEDQQTAAAIMKILGTIILWSFIGVAFFKWYAMEEAEAKGPRWSEVEAELRREGLTREA